LELRSFESRLAKLERTTTSRTQSQIAHVRICVLAVPRVEPSIDRRTDDSRTALWTQCPAVESPPERFIVRRVHAPVRAGLGHAAVRACSCTRPAHAAGQLGPLQTATHTPRPSPILSRLRFVRARTKLQPSEAELRRRPFLGKVESVFPSVSGPPPPSRPAPPYTPPRRRRPTRPCR
jgi:hypothetical protein